MAAPGAEEGSGEVTPERWQEVKTVLAVALEKKPAERAAYLDQACTDSSLRLEVESLILSHEQGDSNFLERPVVGIKNGGGLPSGTKLGAYEVLARIGSGGMGEVYQARDTRLNRTVAIKILPAHLAASSESRERFDREARMIAGLNHPHICTLHDVGHQGDRDYLVMECLEGETLASRLSTGPLPLEKTLQYAIQIADALGAAHKAGMVHRDVKPSNVFVTARGDIKLMDFGLAKPAQPENLALADAPTISAMLTIQGQIVGTIAYMSPEQVRGEEVDVRSDIFSFGTVIYEMASGRHAFNGNSAAVLIAAILQGEPKALRELNPDLPEELQRIVAKALEKDRDDRYQTADDVMVDLRRLLRQRTAKSQGEAEVAKTHRGSARFGRKTVWISAVVLIAGVLAVIAGMSGAPAISTPLPTEQITFSNEIKGGPIVTDGTRLYFQSEGTPVEMSVKGGPTAPLRADLSGLTVLDISADASKLLALKVDLSDETGRGSLWTVPVLGGSPSRLGDQRPFDASWSPDGRRIVYAELGALLVGDNDGANLKKIWNAQGLILSPRFSRDSRRIRVTLTGSGPNAPLKIWEMNDDGSNAHPLLLDWPAEADQRDGTWTPDGKRFVFLSSRDGLSNVYELSEPRWFEFWKKPAAVRLTSEEMDVVGMTPSRDSTGLFVVGRLPRGSLQAYDEKEKRFLPYLDGLPASTLIVSPDRKWVAYSDYPRHFLWRSNLDGSEKLQLTDISASMPQWSPDSKAIAFASGGEIYSVSADGGAPEKLSAEGNFEVVPTWSPDGKSVLFNDYPVPGHFIGLKVFDLASRRVTTLPGSEGHYVACWSPDGQNLVSIANPPKRVTVYSAKTGTWKDLKRFEADWGYWVWANDSRSIYMAKISPEPGEPAGIYRLWIADGRWELVAKFDGENISSEGFENFPSLTPDGRIAMMSDTSVVQIYSAKWDGASGSR
jgi:eukaryotic-like serine/threonine-protein kinase